MAILEGLVKFDYKALNTSFSYLNYLPEPLVILLGLPIFSITQVMLYIFNSIYFIYLYFSEMSWFFKTNKNDGENKQTTWIPVNCDDFIKFSQGLGLVFVFSILFIFIIIFAWPVFPFIGMFYSFYSIFTYSSIDRSEKPMNAFSIILKLFQYYKVTITICLSILITLSTMSNLGTPYTIGVVLALIILAFGLISSNMFISIKPDDLTEVVSNMQAVKKCLSSSSKVQKGGFFNTPNIKSEIKKLTKKMSKLTPNKSI